MPMRFFSPDWTFSAAGAFRPREMLLRIVSAVAWVKMDWGELTTIAACGD